MGEIQHPWSHHHWIYTHVVRYINIILKNYSTKDSVCSIGFHIIATCCLHYVHSCATPLIYIDKLNKHWHLFLCNIRITWALGVDFFPWLVACFSLIAGGAPYCESPELQPILRMISIEFSVFKAAISLPQGNIQNVFGFKGDEFYLSGDTAIPRSAHLFWLPT